VSDFGSQAGAATLVRVRSDAVGVAARNTLTSAHITHQAFYSNVCAVLDEEVTGSNPVTPTQVKSRF
jgi:hypothetical protein